MKTVGDQGGSYRTLQMKSSNMKMEKNPNKHYPEFESI